MPAIAVIDDSLPRSARLDSFEIAPDGDAPGHSEFFSFARGDSAVRPAFERAGNPRSFGLDVLHEHQSDPSGEKIVCLLRTQCGRVRFVSAHVANTKTIAAAPKSRRRNRRDCLGGVEASHAVGRGENVTWKNQPER